MFKATLTAKKSLGTMNYAQVQGYSEELDGNYTCREKVAYMRSEHLCEHCRQNKN